MAIILPPNSTGTTVDTVTLAAKDRELIVLGGDGAAAEIVGVSNTVPAGSEYGVVTRNIERVDGSTLTTANLGISGVFTQTGQDRSADGIVFVQAAARADVASATDGFVIEEYDLADDFVNANFVRTVAATSVSANTTTRITGFIRARKWRVKYTNGGTAQTSFTLAAAAGSINQTGQADFDTGTGTQLLELQGVALPGAGGPVVGGTSTNPLRIDPTGTTTQPVSGTITIGTFPDNEPFNLNQVGGAAVTLGQKTSANSIPIVPPSDYTPPDTVGTLAALNAANAAASVVLAGQQSAGVLIAAGTLAATVVPEVSMDGGTTWTASFFRDPITGALSTSQVFTNPNAATQLSILSPGGSSNARVRVSAFTSGTANATLRATLAQSDRLATQPVSIAGNQAVNVAQINGVTPLMGNGVTGTGSQRVTIASDNTAFAVNSTLSAETTKVIGTVRVQGNVGGVMDAATDAAVPANALQMGGRAAVANPTAVAAGDLVAPMCDILGKQVVRAEAPRERVVQNTITLTSTTETTLIAAGAAGVFRDLTAVTLANTSATGVRVDLRDATAGTVRWSFWVPATQTVGAVLRVPAAQTTAANNWTAQLSAAVTDVRIFAQSIETV